MRRSSLCPSCKAPVAQSRRMFRENFRCGCCGAKLYVSGAYRKCVLLLSVVLGFLAVWIVGIRDILHFCLYWLPVSFVLLTVLVPRGPRLNSTAYDHHPREPVHHAWDWKKRGVVARWASGRQLVHCRTVNYVLPVIRQPHRQI